MSNPVLAAAEGMPKVTKIEGLSFVAMRGKNGLPKPTNGQLPRCFWNVKSTGDHGKDEALGCRMALEFLSYQNSDDSGPILPNVVNDMPQEVGPIEMGFLTIIGFAAATTSGVNEAYRIVRYWEKCASEPEGAQS